MLRTIRTAAVAFVLFTFICGVVYPLFVTGIAQVFFAGPANGSIILKEGTPVGSSLVGQQFNDPRYFWGRPSATFPYPYNAASSSGSNMGPNNPALLETVRERTQRMRAAHPMGDLPVPVDLVTASASGLDPHISPAAAEYQIKRVAMACGLDEALIRRLVVSKTENRQLGILGEPRINVLKLNLALDEYQ
jgi:K+-transporting ATPase ATPase C chain